MLYQKACGPSKFNGKHKIIESSVTNVTNDCFPLIQQEQIDAQPRRYDQPVHST